MPARLLLALAALLLSTAAGAIPASPEAGEPRAEKWAGGLRMPVDIEWGKDGHLYVAELAAGDVLRLKDGRVVGDPVGHVDVTFGGERGLVGMALDPTNAGRVWIYYTVAGGTVDDTTDWRGTNQLSWFEAGVEHKVSTFKAGLMHNSGRLAFANDGGSLYVAVGDTADRAATQDLEVPEGKLLRLDRDGKGVPGNFRDRIVSYGHRNMYGLAVAPDGTVLVTENMNGQNDEVNLDRVGGDFGWPHCEGTNKTDAKEPCNHEQVDPLFQYHLTISPTGAAWMGGSFWFAAFNRGDVHRVSFDGESWQDEIAYHHPDTPRILDVTPGPEGNTLYFSVWTRTENPDDSEGQIWKLTFPALPASDPNVRGLGLPADGATPTPARELPAEPPWKRYVSSGAVVAVVALAAGAFAGRRGGP